MPKAINITKALKAITSELEEMRVKKVKALIRPLENERRKLHTRVEQIDRLIDAALGQGRASLDGTPDSKPKTTTRRKRIRRSGEALKKIADSVVAFIKSKGKEGVTAGDIKAAFGQLFPSPPQFVKKHAGIQLQRKGHAKRPRYFLV